MAHLSFPQRLNIWWNASRLLAGLPVRAEFWDTLPQKAQNLDCSRWESFAPKPEQDGRFWLLAGLKKESTFSLSGIYRYALTDLLYSEMQNNAKEFVRENIDTDFLAALISLYSPKKKEEGIVISLTDLSPYDQILVKAIAILQCKTDLSSQISLSSSAINGAGVQIQNQNIPWMMLGLFSNSDEVLKHLIEEGVNPKIPVALPLGITDLCNKIRLTWWKKLCSQSKLSQQEVSRLQKRWDEPLKPFKEDPVVLHACDIYGASMVNFLIKGGYAHQDLQALYEKVFNQGRWGVISVLAQQKAPLFLSDNIKATLQSWGRSDYETTSASLKESVIGAFQNLLPLLPEICPEWNSKHATFGQMLLEASENKTIYPEFISALLQGQGSSASASWWTWHNTITTHGGSWKEYVLDHVFSKKNHAFMRACADQGLTLSNLHRENSIFNLIISQTPQSLGDYLNDVSVKQYKIFWNYPTKKWIFKDQEIMKEGQSALELVVQSPMCAEIIKTLSKHTNACHVLKMDPPEKWMDLALKAKSLENINVILEHIGSPQWKNGDAVFGWQEALSYPLNSAILEKALEQKWALNVRIDEQGNTPLLRLMEIGDCKWIKRFIEHGADVHWKNEVGISSYDKASQRPDLNMLELFSSAAQSVLDTNTAPSSTSSSYSRRL